MGDLIKSDMIHCLVPIGIKLHKSHASIFLHRYRSIVNPEYRICHQDEYILIPLLHVLPEIELEYSYVTYDFPLKKRKKRSIREILEEKLDSSLHPFIPSAFDQIGEIAVIDIKDEMDTHRNLIGEAILQLNPKIRTVYRKSSKVDGVYRIRELELLAGEDNSITIHKEHGIRFYLDLKAIYFSPRLSHEHERIANLVQKGENIYDMFCAMSPFALHILQQVNVDIVVLDINPAAKELIEETIHINRQLKGIPEIIIQDAHKNNDIFIKSGKKFSRIIMNHPSGAIQFLEEAILLLESTGVIHFYCFAPTNDTNTYCENLIKPYNINISAIHRVRQSSPSEYHLCIDLRFL